ncbi:MAG: beta-ketoacyl-[acyl-carrier-protein] synthase family protein [Planctomycetes bacterium]|nr:beta-ketoacyl-[acyl-carrier-protein] synthase family protein [Planctomycetota bacterium]MCB9934203.1 beta-ketoacyl-[acyl-carrier-protein] synthase family protein [Planctomycetota bacterium]
MTQQPLELVAITGLGVIGACGRGLPTMDQALREGREGVGALGLWQSSLGDFPVGQYRGDLEADLDNVPGLTPYLRKRLSRSDALALVAAAEAVGQAGLPSLQAFGAYVGQSVCGTLTSEALYIEARRRANAGNPEKVDMRGAFVHEGANTLDRLAEAFGLRGPTLSFMTACSSAANAIGLAADAIRAGRCEVMLAGGADSLSRIAFNGFCSLKVVSPDGPRPFDRERQGMMVGEGAGMLVLESAAHAKARGARVLAWLSGYGHSCDAHHLTAPHPEGKGAIAAMREALELAGLRPSDIGYINAHGTATLDNDRTEARAISSLFGEGAVPVSSTKRFFGHTLAAAGGIEAVVSVWALRHKLLPANLGVRVPLEEAKLDLVTVNQPAQGLHHVLSNSFGFGGNNAALVFTEAV